MISQNGVIFSMLSILKMLHFFLAAEALMSLIYHCPTGENSNFCSSYFETNYYVQKHTMVPVFTIFPTSFSLSVKNFLFHFVSCENFQSLITSNDLLTDYKSELI